MRFFCYDSDPDFKKTLCRSYLLDDLTEDEEDDLLHRIAHWFLLEHGFYVDELSGTYIDSDL